MTDNGLLTLDYSRGESSCLLKSSGKTGESNVYLKTPDGKNSNAIHISVTDKKAEAEAKKKAEEEEKKKPRRRQSFRLKLRQNKG